MLRDHPFVGRKDSLRRLDQLYDEAMAGRATIGFVTGEPGAGKTALVEEFARRQQERDQPPAIARGSCNAQTGLGDPYLPFREILSQLAGDVDEDVEQGRMTEEEASRLRRLAQASVQVFVESGPDLVGLLIPGGSLIARLGAKVTEELPWRRKLERLVQGQEKSGTVDRSKPGGAGLDQERIFEQVTDVLRNLARQQPLMLVLDDLQWADEASIGLLFHLARRLGSVPLLIVAAYRPADVSAGRAGARHPLETVLNEIKRYHGDVWIDLDASSEASRRELFDELIDTLPNRLDDQFREALYRHTRGHPLFTLELYRYLREEGHLVRDDQGRWFAETLPDWEGLPVRLEGVISERLARLDEGLREVLRIGSVEGERFRAQVVARVLDLEERPLIRRLSGELEKEHQIVRSEGLRRVDGQRLAEFRFRHNLFQKYLYESLDEMERTLIHEQVGQTLEELYGDETEGIAPELARHFEAADAPRKAMAYYRAAGEKALELFALEEAIRHFRAAVEQLQQLPEDGERARQELSLQTRLGACLVEAKGYGAPEVIGAYERARTLCGALERETDPPILRGLAVAEVVGGDLGRAYDLGSELLRLGRDESGPLLTVEGHYVLGVTCFWMGRFAESRRHLEQAVASYDPDYRDVHLTLYSQDPKVVCLCRLALTLWYLGYPDAARERAEESLTLANELDHPHSRCYALYFVAHIYLEVGDLARAERELDELNALAGEERIEFWLYRGAVLQAVVAARQGTSESVMATMDRYMAKYANTGSVVVAPQHHGWMARLHLERGELEDGLASVAEGFACLEEREEGYWEAELHRIQGDLLMARAQEAEAAEGSLQKALAIAREQESRSLELRAAMSLGRLWHRQSRTEEAVALLRDLYDWFTEGFDTRDLQEAHALLESWSPGDAFES